MNKGCMFLVALVLGVLSHNAAFAANTNYSNMPYDGTPMYNDGANFSGNEGMIINDGNQRLSYDSNQRMRNINEVGASNDGYYAPGQVDPSCEYRSGPCTCYCPVTRFKPCYYTEKHCVKEPYCEYKRCCRYVPQYSQKQCCRYVPQYYCKTVCRYVPEYYCVPVQKCRTRVVCEQKCRYVPCTYMKKTCCDCPPSGGSSCAPAMDCPSGSCPRG